MYLFLYGVLLLVNGNKFLSIKDDEQMYSKLNEKSELESFRNRHSDEELESMVSEYRGLWEPAFRYNSEDRVFPLHPWKVLKMERRAYAELEDPNGDWPCMEKRHALRVVKDEYVEDWRELAYGDN